uniref:Uncharacterized protein n=1 Tax=Panagrolaimus sp. ES5 TaxID=591445 RepID=A0AC34GSN0_9BILA
MNSAECLMELDQRPSVKHCHDETLRDIEKANGESGITMPIKLDRMCEALNFFSGCVRHPIRHNCGLEAWQVIFRVLKDTTKTLMPACQFTGTSKKIAHNRHHSKPTPTNSEAAGHLTKPASVDPREKPEKSDIHLKNNGIPESVSYNRETSSDHRNPSFSEAEDEQHSEDVIVVTEEHAQFSQLEGKPESVPSSALFKIEMFEKM